MKKALVLLAGLLLACTVGGSNMDDQEFVITASFPLEEDGLGYRLRIDHTGSVELVVQSNYDAPDQAEIGYYRKSIKPEQAAELRQALKTIGEKPLPKGAPPPPGSDMVLVTLEENGQKRSESIDPHVSTRAMCATADRLKAVGKEARENPVRVVRLSMEMGPESLSVKDTLEIAVRLTGVGSDTALVVDPLEPQEGSVGGFTLRAVRSDLPIEEMWPQHSKHLKLGRESLSSYEMIRQPDSDWLVLKPKQSALFEFGVPVDWESGRYDVHVIFETVTSDEQALSGRIRSAPIPLVVK